MIEKGADLSITTEDGNTPLHMILQYKNDEKEITNDVKFMIEKGVDLNVKNLHGNTPLHISLYNKFENISILLIEKGVDIKVKNLKGETLLHIALENKFEKISKLLIQKGADMNLRTLKGESALHIAIRQFDIKQPQPGFGLFEPIIDDVSNRNNSMNHTSAFKPFKIKPSRTIFS